MASKYIDDAAADAGSEYDETSSEDDGVASPPKKTLGKPHTARNIQEMDDSDSESENDEDRAFIAPEDEDEDKDKGKPILSHIKAEVDAAASEAMAAVIGIKQRHAEQARDTAALTPSANAAALAARDKARAETLTAKGGGIQAAALKGGFARAMAAKRARDDEAAVPSTAKRARAKSESDSEFESSSDDEEEEEGICANPVVPVAQAQQAPKVDTDDDDDEQPKVDAKPKPRRVTGNKTLADPLIPPKPNGMVKHYGVTSNAGAAAPNSKDSFRYRIVLTNAQSLFKFLSGIVKQVPEMRFHLVHTKSFQGFRIEAHDASLSLAAKSRYKCDLVVGTDADGSALDEAMLNGISFCVSSESFVLALDSAEVKSTNMYITQYHATAARPQASDELRFETVTDEGESCGVVFCRTIESDRLKSLSGIKVQVAFHEEVSLLALKTLCTRAKKARAATTTFKVERCEDPDDAAVMHSRLSIGFSGCIDCDHVFFVSMRAVHRGRKKDGKTVIDWEMLPNVPYERRAHLDYAPMCTNVYNSKKLRLFLRNMEGTWAMIHLSPGKPLIMEISTADKSTQHLIIVATQGEEE